MTSTERTEVRANIKFCMELGKTPTETFKMLQRTPSNCSVKRALVFKWYKRFADGRDSLEDDEGRGRKTKISSDVVASVREALDGDRRLTVRTLSAMIGVSVGTIYTILTEHLKMTKVHARWVPRLLKDSEKERRVKDSKTFIKRYEKDGDDFLNRIITTDETWLWFFDPETKSQSAVWKRSSSPPPEKARVNKCGAKYMFIMFCDRQGMLLCHAVPRDSTVNAEYYSKVYTFLIIICFKTLFNMGIRKQVITTYYYKYVCLAHVNRVDFCFNPRKSR